MAGDENTVYFAGYDPFSKPKTSFVFALNSDDSQKSFSAGKSYNTAWGSDTYKSVIAKYEGSSTEDAYISGLAVQRTGDFLFISYRNQNKISVFNKFTGAIVQTLPITDPNQLFIDANGNGDLWINHQGVIEKYTINGDGRINSSGVTLAKPYTCLGIGGKHDGSSITIIDGNTQTIRTYNATDGSFKSSFGQDGGYLDGNPKVYDNKFYFSNTGGLPDTVNTDYKVEQDCTFITYLDDGSFWVGDSNNFRDLHFSASNEKLDEIQYMGMTRSVGVDPNDPTRAFANWLEFKVDYSIPLGGHNGSWKLVRNWKRNTEKDNEYYRLRFVYTLSNGKTYTQIPIVGTNVNSIYELDETTGLRKVDFESTFYGGWYLQKDGSLQRYTNSGVSDNKTLVWEKRDLTGFDANNNPKWDGVETLVQLTGQNEQAPYFRYGIGFNTPVIPSISENNVLFSWESHKPGLSAGGYHLGGIKLGQSNWKFKTMPSTTTDYTGDFPTDGRYDIGNGVQYPGGPAIVIDDLIFAGYHGEFWKQSSVNMWHIFKDDGLMVGLFGVLGPDVRGQIAAPGSAGNVLSANVIKYGSNYYLYHADENSHGGINRWKISNLESIHEYTLSIK